MNPEPTPTSDKEILRHARGQFACMAGAYGLGTFNDNFFKQAALVLFVAAGRNDMQGYALTVFTIPFILFAAPAGWCADRFMKSHVVVAAKSLELVAMLFGAVGVATGYSPLIFTMLFIMGTQATILSPALNGSLPDLYPQRLVPHANGILRLLVTVAILGGVATAGMLLDFSQPWFWGIEKGHLLVAFSVIAVAVVGVLVSLGVPKRPAANPHAVFPWDGKAQMAGVLLIALALGLGWGSGTRHAPAALQALLRVLVWPLLVAGIATINNHTVKDLWETRKDPLLAASIFTNVFFWLMGSLGILVVNPLGIQEFHMTKTMTSYLIVSQLCGIAIGGLISSKLVPMARWYRIVWPVCLAMSLVMLAMPLVPALPDLFARVALYGLTFLLGFFGGYLFIPMESFLQIRPPVTRKGAVLSAVNFVVFGGIMLSGLFSTYLNTHWRPTLAFGIMGVASLLVTGLLFLLFRRQTEVIGA